MIVSDNPDDYSTPRYSSLGETGLSDSTEFSW